jgi:N-acetylglucosaminyldiphosphoundecaprenol N-acetyl-beta-D-mannosaminyltransferase
MIAAINAFKPDILFVGMTAPKQEKWVYAHKAQIDARIICSIGAVFDFYAGTVKRPSAFWINLGLEWLPRLLKEPRRLARRNFISTPAFLWDVVRAVF